MKFQIPEYLQHIEIDVTQTLEDDKQTRRDLLENKCPIE